MSRARQKEQDVEELHKENQSLKRQLARAEREIARLQGTVEEEIEESPAPERKPSCPKCGSTNLGEVTTPSGKSITACRACKKWRSRS